MPMNAEIVDGLVPKLIKRNKRLHVCLQGG